MKTIRKTEISFGSLYIAATVSGVLSVLLSGPLLKKPLDLTAIASSQNQMLLSAFMLFIMAVTVAGVSFMIYPILKEDANTKAKKGLAVWYLGTRLTEGALFLVGIINTLLLLKLSTEFIQVKGADPVLFNTICTMLLEASEYSWMLGQNIFCIGAVMLYYLLYKSKRVPRWLSVWGIISCPLMFIAGFLPLFGIDSNSAVYSGLCASMAIQEMVLALWVIVRGFNSNEKGS